MGVKVKSISETEKTLDNSEFEEFFRKIVEVLCSEDGIWVNYEMKINVICILK